MPWVVLLFIQACTIEHDRPFHQGGPVANDTAVEPASDVATLTSLDLGAPLAPRFDPAVDLYAVRASALPDPISVVAVPTDPGAAVAVTFETIDGADVSVGNPIPRLADHRVVIEVTSADGGATRRYAVGFLPDGFPELTVSRTGTPSSGWYLLSSFTFHERAPGVGNYLMALDERGTPGWWRFSSSATYDLRVGHDDRLTCAGRDTTTGRFSGITFDESYATSVVRPVTDTPYEYLGVDVHEFDRLADGGSIVLAKIQRTEDLTAYGGAADTAVVHTMVQELDPNGAIRFAWDTTGAVDYATLPDEYLATIADGWEAAHLNSVELDPADGHLVISLRMPSQVVKVARYDAVIAGRTVNAGEIAWRLGGVDSDFTFVGDDRIPGWAGFALQHSARMTGPDTIAVFDNAYHYDLGDMGGARFVEYALDTTAWTATKIAEHVLPSGQSSPACGSVQRLPDGSTLIGWGTIDTDPQVPDLTELDPSGQVVMEITLQGTFASYRAWKAFGDPLTGTWLHPQ